MIYDVQDLEKLRASLFSSIDSQLVDCDSLLSDSFRDSAFLRGQSVAYTHCRYIVDSAFDLILDTLQKHYNL